MKYFLFIFIILISSQSFAYINETYDCKMKNFIGIDKDGLPKKWREQRFSFKWKDDFTIQFGKANIAKEGTDTTIVTYSIMLHKSLEAAKIFINEFDLFYIFQYLFY